MPVQIREMQTEIDVGPPDPVTARPATVADSRAELERLRPIVLQILRDELDRLRRQQG